MTALTQSPTPQSTCSPTPRDSTTSMRELSPGAHLSMAYAYYTTTGNSALSLNQSCCKVVLLWPNQFLILGTQAKSLLHDRVPQVLCRPITALFTSQALHPAYYIPRTTSVQQPANSWKEAARLEV